MLRQRVHTSICGARSIHNDLFCGLLTLILLIPPVTASAQWNGRHVQGRGSQGNGVRGSGVRGSGVRGSGVRGSGVRGHGHHGGHHHGGGQRHRSFYGGSGFFGGSGFGGGFGFGRGFSGVRYHHRNIYVPPFWGTGYGSGWGYGSRGFGVSVFNQPYQPVYPYDYGYVTPYVAAPFYQGQLPPASWSVPTVDPNAGLLNDPLLDDTLLENQQRWEKNQPVVTPNVKTVAPFVVPSSPEATLKSLRSQAQGDELFRRGEYLKAIKYYDRAIRQAPDRAEPQFLNGYAFVALRRYEDAVRAFQRGLELQPEWPKTGPTLTEIFGDDNQLAISLMKESVIEWVRNDIRDADRLFVLGVLLHFSGDRQNAGELFTTALRLSGGGTHLVAFLDDDFAKVEAVQPAEKGPVQPAANRSDGPTFPDDGTAPVNPNATDPDDTEPNILDSLDDVTPQNRDSAAPADAGNTSTEETGPAFPEVEFPTSS